MAAALEFALEAADLHQSKVPATASEAESAPPDASKLRGELLITHTRGCPFHRGEEARGRNVVGGGHACYFEGGL